MTKQAKTEPMEYPTERSIPKKVLKTWLALAATPEQRAVVRGLLKEQSRRH